ncbi:SERTA domain-containing protein 2b isoform X2 [Anabas testudineus]|uniref:SERTA domain-containing protein n=2 Tax=Anabas testudineus TaxID=64144 RepID=A0A3Q1HXE8_ANATE|nr:SERTA domain-containing protein 2b isoform X2 [Anabas testudineus]XP_026211276.1 SERTA domain-containing protein 2b isoform X2 [Anabas testudineus]XP_026211277.1 SERTA domain-containing protein 2b isoform X2 [Anabas testudineus]XP_026211278.1 SERTA domain-containing protein 2b isoform X2 [Anabas testudineus]
MFGKGAKRKLDEDEEGLEGKTLEASMAGGGPGLGPEGLSKVSYTLQRQTIFNISLMKLYSQRPLGEPSLERRVLINNMLRRIQEELKQEGSLRPLLLPPSPPPDDPMDEGFREAPPSFGVLSAAATAQVSQSPALLMPAIAPPPSPHPMVPPNCQASQACSNHVEACPAPLESCLTPASLLEEDGGDSAFCTPSPPTPPLSPPPVLNPSLPSALLSQASPRVPVPPTSNDDFPSTLSDMELGPPTAITRTAAANTMTVTTSPAPTPLTQPSHIAPLSPAPTGGHPKDCRAMGAKPEAAGILLAESRCADLRSMDTLPTLPPGGLVDISSSPSSPSSSSPSGFLSDLALDDVLFADIDTSMYDFDPCTTGGAVGMTAGGGLAKLSPVVTADDLLKSLSSPYSGPTPQVSANQPFKIDLTELDHIMEVLVGS